jgi:hypothetical protein
MARVAKPSRAGGLSPLSGRTVVGSPTLTSIDPAEGDEAGGDVLTLTGTRFLAGMTVTIDGNACTDVTILSETSAQCTTPAGTGTCDVVVATGYGSDTLVGGFEYTGTPATFGAGPNAPGYATTYTPETFDAPIPVSPSAPAASTWQGNAGFDGFSGITYNPTRITYPTVSTPLGTRPVLQVTFPGQRENITALDGATTDWPSGQEWGLQITGTWVGTLAFEVSDDDGETWNPITMTGREGSANGTSTAINGVWDNRNDEAEGLLFRVRASAWVSGTAVVTVGFPGAGSPVSATALTVSGTPTKMYQRTLIYISPTFNNNGNAGTKFFWPRTVIGEQNHYVEIANSDTAKKVHIRLQNISVARSIDSANGKMPYGSWLDVEWRFELNTGGNTDGTLRVWINGELVIEETDVLWLDVGDSHAWTLVTMSPTYGGGWKPSPSTADVWYRIAGWYAETE